MQLASGTGAAVSALRLILGLTCLLALLILGSIVHVKGPQSASELRHQSGTAGSAAAWGGAVQKQQPGGQHGKEQEAARHKGAEQQAAGQQAAEQEAARQNPAGQQTAEQKTAACLLPGITQRMARMCQQQDQSAHASQVLKMILGARHHHSHFTVGQEAWTRNTLQEIASEDCPHLHVQLPGADVIPLPEPTSPLLSHNSSNPRLYSPEIFVAFSTNKPNRKASMQQRLAHMGIPEDRIHWVSFGELEDIQANSTEGEAKRAWIAQYVWSYANASGFAPDKGALAAYSSFQSMHLLCHGAPGVEAGILLEDDAASTYDFQQRFRVFMNQLSATDPAFDLAFLGNCLNMAHAIPFSAASPESYSPKVPGTRCFNAVLVSRAAACKVLAAGPALRDPRPSDDDTHTDFVFNRLIPQLSLSTHWAQPPLFEESSKAAGHVLCDDSLSLEPSDTHTNDDTTGPPWLSWLTGQMERLWSGRRQ